jgi:antitoxin MazE
MQKSQVLDPSWTLLVAQILFAIYNWNVYQGGEAMQVSKWGNSLAVRLPKAVVDALDLKEGDQIEIRIARERVFEVSRDQSKPHALARLRKLRRPLPPGFVFDREEANAR